MPIEFSAIGIITPTCWDSDPLALNLKHAYNGFPNCPKWAEGGAFLINKLLALSKNKPILPGDDFVKCKSGLQKLADEQLMSSHYNLDFIKHMTERIESLFHPQKLNWNCIQFENSIAALKPFDADNVMKVIKTMFNAWTTSSRMGGAHFLAAGIAVIV